jgi:hypothetical protein
MTDPSTPDTEAWYSRRAAATYLGVDPSTVDAYVRAGQLQRYHLASPSGATPQPRYRIEDLKRLVTP